MLPVLSPCGGTSSRGMNTTISCVVNCLSTCSLQQQCQHQPFVTLLLLYCELHSSYLSGLSNRIIRHQAQACKHVEHAPAKFKHSNLAHTEFPCFQSSFGDTCSQIEAVILSPDQLNFSMSRSCPNLSPHDVIT